MRGEQELNCLSLLRKYMFYQNNQPRQDPFTGQTYLDVSDNEFRKLRLRFVNPECKQTYFGLLIEDRVEFENGLRKAQPNPEPSLFPDFVFENGFIEHFQITSSKETRKGATHTREESKLHRAVDDKMSEWDKTPSFDEVRSECWSMLNPQHNYQFLIQSFQRNWESHYESYQKYTGPKQVGIFMIEYPELALAMRETTYDKWIEYMSNGDMRRAEKFKEYRLSRDKELLKYIYQFKDDIKYVVFKNCRRFEVICTQKIPYLLELLPWDYSIYPLYVTNVSTLYNISVPEEEGETDGIS